MSTSLSGRYLFFLLWVVVCKLGSFECTPHIPLVCGSIILQTCSVHACRWLQNESTVVITYKFVFKVAGSPLVLGTVNGIRCECVMYIAKV